MCECRCGLDCVWNGGVVSLSSWMEGVLLLPINEQCDFLALCRVCFFSLVLCSTEPGNQQFVLVASVCEVAPHR